MLKKKKFWIGFILSIVVVVILGLLLHPDAPKVEIPKIITDRIARMKEKGGKSNA